jgi:putative oxidoreductase
MKISATEICSALLILLFIYTGASKLLDMERFVSEVNNQPVPGSLKPFLAWGLPVLEIIIAICLLFDRWRSIGFFGSMTLMFLFTAYTALVLLRVFNRIPCSCGGVIRQLTWPQHLVFNIFFSFIAVWGYIKHTQGHKIQNAPDKNMHASKQG